ncbi:complement C1q tumor necrosis factor-related protein 3-like [Protopterus annectens]|uniref:complement C1q tumor necrosis factor-related protein 3-like n=1 Tax=Protopterus annectens TaxID=7888 RepID=UPI001CF97C7D|nr:complement C1q tumor necrosis factor-related protein 3-like [Protopterus annectens]
MKIILLVLLEVLYLAGSRKVAGSDGINFDNNSNNDGRCKAEFCQCAALRELAQLKESTTNLENTVLKQNEKINDLQEELKKIKDNRVAFLVKLSPTSGNIFLGPFNTATTVKFPTVVINIGNCYNPSTGIFTARAKGVYVFTFTVFKNSNSQPLFTSLMHNGVKILSYWDSDNADTHDSGTNTATLEVEVGDSIYILLHENRQIYDDANCYISFTGFLLYML